VSNNITIKDGSNANVVLHTIEDATSVHFNQSIPTDTANNTATVVSGGQAVASGMGALVVAQRDALPAGTNHLGKVSIVGSVSIQQTGALFTQAQGQYLATPPTLVDATVSTLQVDQRGSLRVTLMSPDSNGGIGKTSSFTDANINNQNRITTESYPMVFNRASSTWDRLTGTSVGLAVTQAGNWSVSVGDKVSVSGLVGLNAGANLIGAVSISPNGLNIPVSIAGVPNVNIAGAIVSTNNLATITAVNGSLYTIAQNYGWDGTAWRIMSSDTSGRLNVNANVSLGGSTALIGSVSISPNGLNIPVSAGSRGFPNSDALGLQTADHLRVLNANYVYTKISDTWDRMTGTSAGLYVQGNASAGATNLGRSLIVGGTDGANNRTLLTTTGGALVVHISNALPAAGASMLQTVGAAVTNQGYPMLGTDGTNARGLLTTTGGALVVHVSNAQPTPSGISMTQTVGAAVTTQGYPMLGTDGTNARGLLTTTGGALIVHVSNTAPGGGAGGSSMTQTVGAAVTNQGYPMIGTDGTNARIIRTDTLGRVSLADTFFNVGVNVALPAGTNLIGAVSISPNGLNIPVSVANTINVNTHAVTQSGAWNVGLNAGTALIGAVSISPNGLNIPVSIANTVNVATHAVTQSGTWNIGAISSINSIVRVSIEGTFAPGGGGAMTQTVGAAVTNQGYPMLGTDGTNARGLLTTTGGALVVHISNALPAAGASMLQTVGAAVTTQGYPMLGTDGTNARGLLTTTGGALIVHVSNSAPGGGGGGGGTPMVSIGGAVSLQAVQIAGSDTQNNARTIKTNVSGAVFISTRTFMSQYTFTRPADTTAYAAGTTAAPGAAGDLIANSVTNTAVVPLKFRVARSSGQNGGVAYIRGARMFRTGGTAAAGQHSIVGAIRLHLFNTNNRVSVAGGDNAAFNASPVSNWMGYIDLVAIACAPGLRTSGAVSTQVYWGSPARTGEMLVNLSATQVSIQGLLETRVAFTPISGEIFTVQIEGFNG
jgi:hypothetical protein